MLFLFLKNSPEALHFRAVGCKLLIGFYFTITFVAVPSIFTIYIPLVQVVYVSF